MVDKDDDLGLSLALKCPEALPQRPLNLFVQKKALCSDAFHASGTILLSLSLCVFVCFFLLEMRFFGVQELRSECLLCRDESVPERHRRESGTDGGGLRGCWGVVAKQHDIEHKREEE